MVLLKYDIYLSKYKMRKLVAFSNLSARRKDPVG